MVLGLALQSFEASFIDFVHSAGHQRTIWTGIRKRICSSSPPKAAVLQLLQLGFFEFANPYLSRRWASCVHSKFDGHLRIAPQDVDRTGLPFDGGATAPAYRSLGSHAERDAGQPWLPANQRSAVRGGGRIRLICQPGERSADLQSGGFRRGGQPTPGRRPALRRRPLDPWQSR
jgi:hypothetical protein